MRTDILEQKDKILMWINEKRSKHYISQMLNCKQETLNKYLKMLNISYDGNQGHKGEKLSRPKKSYMPLEEYIKNSTNIHSNKIRIKLIREGYKEQKCERCGITEWLGMPISLELHHIDGNHHNNEISNFQILCPNCHSLTGTYRGKEY